VKAQAWYGELTERGLCARSRAGGRSPAEDEQGHAEGCHRLEAAVAERLAQGD
jgi:hypothetical protein